MLIELKVWQPNGQHTEVAKVHVTCGEYDLPEIFTHKGKAYLRDGHFHMKEDKLARTYYEVRSNMVLSSWIVRD